MSAFLEVKDLAISFGGVKALQGIHFTMGKGEILGLIGPNGSGKSTAVNIISGVYKQDRGEILFDGQNIPQKMPIHERAKVGMARTFQTPKPFGHYTVWENIYSIALLKHSHKEAAEKTRDVLKMTKLEPYTKMLSAKLPIEKRKWLDLARILATSPKLIMLDEVMAGLNTSEMGESLDLVRTINKEGISIMFIEHVMKAVVDICPRVVVLNEGKILAEGECREVLGRKEVIEAYIGEEIKNA